MYLVCGEALYDLFVEEEKSAGQLGINGLVGGSPFNVAIGMSRLGADVGFFASLSTDMLGERLLSRLDAEKVDTSYIVRTGRRTTISMVGLDEGGHPAYVFYGTGSADTNIKTHDLPTLPDAVKGLHFGSYASVVEPASSSFLALCERHQDKFISLDPNVRLNVEPDVGVWRARLSDFASYADFIKISQEDLEAIFPDIPAEQKAQEWMEQGVDLVVLTDGGESISVWHSKLGRLQFQPTAVEVVDTVGAGDSFQAALLTMLSELGSGDPKQAVASLTVLQIGQLIEFSSSAARITCSRRGADLPHRADLSGTVGNA